MSPTRSPLRRRLTGARDAVAGRLPRAVGRWMGAPGPLAYHMFDDDRLELEARAARSLERVYHVGQERIWDGRAVLAELIERHGPAQLPPEQLEAIKRVFNMILWGELAAWKVSAELAARIEPLEAKLAATAQAHDEARHFYVMHDYLRHLGHTPEPPPGIAGMILERVLLTDDLAKKLVGMQLMIEPIALTIFGMTRRSGIEPVLCDLLGYYERDEARHVTLGVKYLPELVRGMGWAKAIDYWAFQAQMYGLETLSIRDLEDDFRALGFEPREVFRLGQGKQITVMEMLADELGGSGRVPVRALRALFDFAAVYSFPEGDEGRDRISRIRNGVKAAWRTEAKAGDLVVPQAG